MRLQLTSNLHSIMSALSTSGHKVFVVGGALRDSLLYKKPNDWDLATSATPKETKQVTSSIPNCKTFDLGIEFGTVVVSLGGEEFEVTTFRTDGASKDCRKPNNVTFTTSIEEDLSRRDFTFNAMAFHPDTGLLDPFNGAQDLKDKLVRTVGDANLRFKEDALRMLRSARFACQLGFELEEKTKAAMIRNFSLLNHVSKERVRDEFCKILLSPNPDLGLSLLQETGLIEHVLPYVDSLVNCKHNNPHHIHSIWEHTLAVVKNTPCELNLRLAGLFHEFGKPSTKTVGKDGFEHFPSHADVSAGLTKTCMKSLKFDNNTIKSVVALVRFHDAFQVAPTSHQARRLLALTKGFDNILTLSELARADVRAQSPERTQGKLEQISKMVGLAKECVKLGHAFNLSHLSVTGSDVQAITGVKGKGVGELLKSALEYVVKFPERNNRRDLENFLKSAIDSLGD